MTIGEANPASNLTAETARALAREAGFAEAGVAALPHAEEERDSWRFAGWVQAGRAGTMKYLQRRDEAGRLVRDVYKRQLQGS